MITADDISPAATPSAAAAPTPAPEPAAAPTTTAEPPQIPDEVLKLPVFNMLLQGAPPAVRTNPDDKSPVVQTLGNSIKSILGMGFGLFKPTSMRDQVVLFNQKFVSPKELQLADKHGKLDLFAPSIDAVNEYATKKLGGDAAQAPSDASGEAPASSPAPEPSTPPAPAGVQRSIANARLRSTAVGSPTSGPVPGQGRILNSILKPVV